MSYIDHFTEFLFDEDRRLSSKAAVVVLIMLTIFLIDNILGFSYSFGIDKKIGHVEKLNAILKDSTVDSTTKAFALNLRSKIIARKNVISQAASFFRSNSTNSIKKNNNTTATPKQIKAALKSNFWFNLTASGIYFLFAIIMIPVMLFTDKTTSFSQRLATGIAATILLFLLGMFFIWCVGFIPQISNSTWIWNYIINFIIQAITIGFLIYVGQQKK